MTFKINPKSQDFTIQIIKDRIEKGFELQELDEEIVSGSDLFKYNDAIIIAPDYQREYRSTIKDESSLIESLLIGIPIPPVFFANDKYKKVPVLNVVDGQHRLRAFYRYVNNEFCLKELSLLEEHENKYFNQLDVELQLELMSKEISSIVFKDFPGRKFELEIFNRYNKGTKPLTPQEIRHAVYNSEFNVYVNSFAKKISNKKLGDIYNSTKDRLLKKKIQESIFVILSILENGIDTKLQKSPEYAEKYMEIKSELQNNSEDEFAQNYEKVIGRFNSFNEFIEIIAQEIQFPFSKEIYGLTNRNYKFQISIAMILAGVYKKIVDELGDKENINSELDINKFKIYCKELLSNSFLENSSYSASSTNPSELIKVIEEFEVKKIIKND